MATLASNDDPITDVRTYLEGVAKSLTDRLFGPAGPPLGTTLASIENTIDSVRWALCERILHLSLSRQSLACANASAETFSCPTCQNPTHTRDPEPRVVTTSVGCAEWTEPHYYCPKCRKAFFPSVQEPRP